MVAVYTEAETGDNANQLVLKALQGLREARDRLDQEAFNAAKDQLTCLINRRGDEIAPEIFYLPEAKREPVMVGLYNQLLTSHLKKYASAGTNSDTSPSPIVTFLIEKANAGSAVHRKQLVAIVKIYPKTARYIRSALTETHVFATPQTTKAFFPEPKQLGDFVIAFNESKTPLQTRRLSEIIGSLIAGNTPLAIGVLGMISGEKLIQHQLPLNVTLNQCAPKHYADKMTPLWVAASNTMRQPAGKNFANWMLKTLITSSNKNQRYILENLHGVAHKVNWFGLKLNVAGAFHLAKNAFHAFMDTQFVPVRPLNRNTTRHIALRPS